MKKWTPYLLCIALFIGAVYVHTRLKEKSSRELNNSLKRIEALKLENDYIKGINDSLLDRAITLDVQMAELEAKADSLGKVATLPMPCEHELELKREEVRLVRGALAKCKESKGIQTTRVGLSEIRVENQVAISKEIEKSCKVNLKEEKRKSFLRGMGAGGLAVGILIILAL